MAPDDTVGSSFKENNIPGDEQPSGEELGQRAFCRLFKTSLTDSFRWRVMPYITLQRDSLPKQLPDQDDNQPGARCRKMGAEGGT